MWNYCLLSGVICDCTLCPYHVTRQIGEAGLDLLAEPYEDLLEESVTDLDEEKIKELTAEDPETELDAVSELVEN